MCVLNETLMWVWDLTHRIIQRHYLC